MAKGSGRVSIATCVCGKVRLEIDVPAIWAWHDHGDPSRHAHGAAYATYVGSWKSRFRILKGQKSLVRFEDDAKGTARSFCRTCGTPVLYEKKRSPQTVNIPRALFETRTGREPRYHLNLGEAVDWAYDNGALAPLKGYPGVMIQRPRRTKRPPKDPAFD